MEKETIVLIVGAGPAGIATSACLNELSIPNIVLEMDNCCGSLWKKRAYDRLGLHLGKKFCQLPLLSFPSTTPKFMSKHNFIKYLDDYVARFNVNPIFSRCVQLAFYDESIRKWKAEVENVQTGEKEVYVSTFLVVATGENGQGVIPDIPGLKSFKGDVIHASAYRSGEIYTDQDVLVIGSGNSGMEISYDLSNYGARASVVVRNSMHILTRELVYLTMTLANHFPISVVDHIAVALEKLMIGNMSKYGIKRPEDGPYGIKIKTGKTPVIDVGTVAKIRSGQIKVVSDKVASMKGNEVFFEGGKSGHYDAIILATGYTSTVKKWLKDYQSIFDDEGMPRNKGPDHWKGDNNIYCVGFSRQGLRGISIDAQATVNEIKSILDMNSNMV
ncbi:hypothetical protein ACFE04_005827 [Oxalis oulophora]